MSTQQARQAEWAALNNGWWCRTMLGAHGVPLHLGADCWWSAHPVPPFHPNLGVLSRAVTTRDVEGLIAERLHALQGTAWSIKDSYGVLDLAPLGFAELFEAQWIWRDADQPPPAASRASLAWSPVSDAQDLAAWERAWQGDLRNAAEPPPVQFPAGLLQDPSTRFFAGRLDGVILAGAIANLSPQVVGVSNLFSPPELAAETWAAVVRLAATGHPERALVGYERGSALRHAMDAGFRTVGTLRVLHRSAAGAP